MVRNWRTQAYVSRAKGISDADISAAGKRQSVDKIKQSFNNPPFASSTPQQQKGRIMHHKTNRHHHGFTLVEIMIVVAIIGLLAAIAIPNFVRARNTSQKNSCINNLRQIDGAKNQWALENKKVDTDTPVNSDITPYLKGATVPTCPANGNYTLGSVATLPSCDLAGSLGHTY
jgi:prepilin-type N-terminal cleavage/methylation domain-containing protein